MEVPARIGRFQIVRRLARGGMAEIFLAKQSGPSGFERDVVVKRVLPGLSEEGGHAQMFLDEARLSARLNHPNVVQVFDFGEAGGSHFLSMEYLVGKDLRTVLKTLDARSQLMPWDLAVSICVAACDGLHYAHELRNDAGEPLSIVHRDVSPANIFLTHQGIVKVLDFGIASGSGRNTETEVGQIKGKLLYMSPEQIQSRPLDRRSDVFALGVVLYEMLTSVRLFDRPSPAETLYAICHGPMPEPSTVRPELSRELGIALLRALDRDPDRRFESAQQMGQALSRLLLPLKREAPNVELANFMRRTFGPSGDSEPVGLVHPSDRATQVEGGTLPSAAFTLMQRVTKAAPMALPEHRASQGTGLGTHTRATPLALRRRRWGVGLGSLALVCLGLAAAAKGWAANHPAPVSVRPAELPSAPAVLPDFLLEVRPPGEVTVNGKSLGRSPVVVHGAQPGLLHLLLADRTRGYRKELDLSAARGMPLRQQVTIAEALLDVRVNPYADVTVDGHHLGLTPLPSVHLLEGPHLVTLRRQGAAPVGFQIDLSGGEKRVFKYRWGAGAPVLLGARQP